MDFRRALTLTGTKVHLSKDTTWQYAPGQYWRGHWEGTTLCDRAVASPADYGINADGEIEFTPGDHRPVDCTACLRYGRREIEHLEKVLSGEW